MATLPELESLITSAKLEYKIECDKLRNLEELYILAMNAEKEASDNLKYIYLIHEINEIPIKPNDNKHTGNILHASYSNDCDFTTLYESIKTHELYLDETKQNKARAYTACKNQRTIVTQATQILQKAIFLRASLLCKSIDEIIEESGYKIKN